LHLKSLIAIGGINDRQDPWKATEKLYLMRSSDLTDRVTDKLRHVIVSYNPKRLELLVHANDSYFKNNSHIYHNVLVTDMSLLFVFYLVFVSFKHEFYICLT